MGHTRAFFLQGPKDPKISISTKIFLSSFSGSTWSHMTRLNSCVNTDKTYLLTYILILVVLQPYRYAKKMPINAFGLRTLFRRKGIFHKMNFCFLWAIFEKYGSHTRTLRHLWSFWTTDQSWGVLHLGYDIHSKPIWNCSAWSQWKTCRRKAWENTREQVPVDFCFSSHWRECFFFFTEERSKAKPKQTWITFDMHWIKNCSMT